MHCSGHNSTGSHLVARVCISGQNETRVKDNAPYLEGQTTRNLLQITFEMFLHNVEPIFYNIRGCALIRGLTFWEICLENQKFWCPN